MTGLPPTPRGLRARFAGFEVDLRAGELFRAGRRLRLRPKAFAVLVALLESPGEVVLRDELRRRLWPDDTVVDFDNNLNSAVNTLRDVLGDTAESPRYVETLPRRGYRLTVPVEWVRAPTSLSGAPGAAAGASRLRRRRFAALAAGGALLAGLAVLVGGRRAVEEASTSPDVAPAAYDAFLRGRKLLDGHRPEEAPAAVAELERATTADPGFAAAWAALAEAWQTVPAPPRETAPRAREAALRALALEDGLADGHLRLGLLHLYFDYDWDAAGRELRRAVELAPGSSRGHQALAGYLAILGRHEEAAAAMRRAMELEPLAVAVAADSGWYRFVARDPRGAVVLARRALDLEPGHPGAHLYLLLAHLALGESAAARDAAVAYVRAESGEPADVAAVAAAVDPAAGLELYRRWSLRRQEAEAAERHVSPAVLALDYLALGERQQALDLLEAAYEARSGWLIPFLGVYPPLDPLRDEPRFRDLERRLAFPPRPR